MNVLKYNKKKSEKYNTNEIKSIFDKLSNPLKKELLENTNLEIFFKTPIFRDNFLGDTLRELCWNSEEIVYFPGQLIWKVKNIIFYFPIFFRKMTEFQWSFLKKVNAKLGIKIEILDFNILNK